MNESSKTSIIFVNYTIVSKSVESKIYSEKSYVTSRRI